MPVTEVSLRFSSSEILGVFEGSKTLLAASHCAGAFPVRRPYRFHRDQCGGAVYLCPVLSILYPAKQALFLAPKWKEMLIVQAIPGLQRQVP